MGSVEKKAKKLKEKVHIYNMNFKKILAKVISNGKDGTGTEYNVKVWRDGHYTCTCDWFVRSPSVKISLWADDLRGQPECSHALAVKMTDDYKIWIRMVEKKDKETGEWILTSEDEEPLEKINVLSLDDDFMKKIKKKKITPIIKIHKGKKIPIKELLKTGDEL